tara:strand:- start:2116 stop:2571 length:456 start_codon:yes stop_codon:yes gene_type:complete
MHGNLLGSIALLLPLILIVIVCVTIFNGVEFKDRGHLERKFFELDTTCRNYLEEVEDAPGWRRAVIAATAIGILVLPVVALCYSIDLSTFSRHSITFSVLFFVSFSILEFNRGYHIYHIMCPRTCSARRDWYPYAKRTDSLSHVAGAVTTT